MGRTPRFWSCDWGTTSFRLRLVERDTLEVAVEDQSSTGARELYEQALGRGEGSAGARAELFATFITSRLETCAGQIGGKERAPLVISGMASSSIGWKEVPYGPVPFRLDGEGLRVEGLDWRAPDCVSETWLVSGVASMDEMMRGEETEALGILGLPELAEARRESVLVLPGTHSKHLEIRENQVTALRTYMTGELFDVLTRHSLLKASVTPAGGEDEPLEPAVETAFEEGVAWVRKRGLARSLFRTRTRAVLDGAGSAENRRFLSGVLIGAELMEPELEAKRFVLGGTGRLAEWYARALAVLAPGRPRWHRVKAEGCALAAAAGQRLILEKQESTR